MKYVEGQDKVVQRLFLEKSKKLRQVAVGCEKAANDVANHAKAGHEGDMAHANERYQNRTTTLTRSIIPELVKADFNEVVAVVYASTEYAHRVETIYPFMFPAMQANQTQFVRRIKEATR